MSCLRLTVVEGEKHEKTSTITRTPKKNLKILIENEKNRWKDKETPAHTERERERVRENTTIKKTKHKSNRIRGLSTIFTLNSIIRWKIFYFAEHIEAKRKCLYKFN